MVQHSLCHGGAALVQAPDTSPVLTLNWECLDSAVCTPIQGIDPCHGHQTAIAPLSEMQPWDCSKAGSQDGQAFKNQHCFF